MKNFDWKKFVPHAIAIGIFLIVALIYCKPALEGKVLQQNDITQWKGMSKDIENYKEKHGEAPLWTNGMFSGMPSYLIASKTNNHLPYYFINAASLFLPKPFNFFFLACVCFYFLSQVLRVNSWIGIIGSLAYAYATYNPIIVAVGHETKMLTIALLPGFIASLILIFERRYWWGAAAAVFFTSSMVSQNHYQIVYYALLIAVAMTIGYATHWIVRKEWKHLAIAGLITVVAGIVGVLSNAVVIFTNYEYTKGSIRGGSALADANSNIGRDGLSKEYAFDYSMYKSEPFVLMVPRMFGGSSDNIEVAEEKSKAIEALQTMPPQLAQQLQGNLSWYWGGIGGTSGPPYVGAIICFLAILGFVVLDNKHKWWILVMLTLSVMMSWGGYFEAFNSVLMDVLPMYNKFRAPSMTIVIPTFLLVMLAVLSLQKILFESDDRAVLMTQLKKGFMITGAVFAVLLIFYFSFDYMREPDKEILKQVASMPDEQVKEQVRSFFNAMKEDRQSLFMGDILRSFFFIAIAGLAIWLYQRKILKPGLVMAAIGLFSFIDVMAIDVKYLSAENYQERDEYDAVFQPSPADQQILRDQSYYRVLNVVGGNIGTAFNAGALTSYFHKNIGGYHPAKLSIYQDLIEKQLYKFPNCQPVINMLNTKYIIYGEPGNPQVQQNPDALGAAWLVKGVRFVNGAKEEMAALDNFNPRDTAIAQKSFSNILKANFAPDPTATIGLVSNNNDVVTYKTKAASEQLAVFSEVYYDKGWNAYVDGKKTEYAKVNYVLRGMMVPVGEHTIEFKFEPGSHSIGWTLTNVCSLLMLVFLAGAIVMEVRRRRTVAAPI